MCVCVHLSFYRYVNPYPTDTLTSAICFVCYKFQGDSKSFKDGGNIVRSSISLDPDEMPSYVLGSKLVAYDAVLGWQAKGYCSFHISLSKAFLAIIFSLLIISS